MKGKPVLALAVLVVAFSWLAAPRFSASAQEDAEAVAQAQADAFDAGDRDAWVASFTSDAVITDVGAGSLAWIGHGAIGLVFDLVASGHLSATVTDVSSNDGIVVTHAEWTDDVSTAAGVSRYLTRTETHVVGDKVTRIDLTYDEDDAQTQTYLAYVASLGNPFPPSEGTVTTTMEGAQAGTASFTPLGDLTAVNVSVASGAAGALQPASLHPGACPAVGAVVTPLASVLNGASVTVLSRTLTELRAADLAVSVAQSESAATPVSCGVLAAASTVPPAAATSPASVPVVAPAAGSGTPPGAFALEMWMMLAALSATALIAVGVYVRRRP